MTSIKKHHQVCLDFSPTFLTTITPNVWANNKHPRGLHEQFLRDRTKLWEEYRQIVAVALARSVHQHQKEKFQFNTPVFFFSLPPNQLGLWLQKWCDCILFYTTLFISILYYLVMVYSCATVVIAAGSIKIFPHPLSFCYPPVRSPSHRF